MMNEYRKKVDEIHAPEYLIEASLNKIREEQKRQEKPSAQQPTTPAAEKVKHFHKPTRWIPMASLAAVAAIVFFIGLNSVNTPEIDLVYHTVPQTIIRTMPNDQTATTISPEEYSAYLGLDIQNLMENAKLIKSEISVTYGGETIRQDECTAYYNVDGYPVTIRFSRSDSLVPEALVGKEASQIDGLTVLASVSQNGKERTAAFEWNGISCCLFSNRMDQQTFEQFLSDFLKVLEKQ